MGFIGSLFGGKRGMGFEAQSGLQPGQLEETYKKQQEDLQRMSDLAAAMQPGGTQGLAAQMDLSKQLAAMSQGQGPSVAQSMLEQERQKQVAQQAALLGSQRGASQNVGLTGRTAARVGADVGMEAAGRAATLRQQEQLGAMEQLRALSGQQVEQQRLGTAGAGQARLAAQEQALGALGRQQAAQAGVEAQTAASQGKIMGGILSGVGSVLGASEGGLMPDDLQQMGNGHDLVSLLFSPSAMAHGAKVPGKAKVDGDSEKNDTVPALLSPGEIVVPRTAAKDPDKAAAFAKSVAMRSRKKKK